MAERTVTVRLKALVDDYKNAMTSAGKATTDAASKADNWKKLGQSTASLGDSMTRNITLPIVAVGAAAVKMAGDFDAAFTNMQTLAGVSADELEGLKESVLNLAGETGKAPQELAEALYFVRSSGLDGAAAMDALEMAAKGSAAGLGSTIQVADALTSAMNAYAASGLSAAEATDVLVKTAQEGKVEPAELAGQMGRLVPVAADLGITFNDVGAAISTISLVGNDASTASTQLANVMSKLQRPSIQAREALAAVGISVDDIRSMIAEQGLLGTLETLKASLGDNGFTMFLEDQQAVAGATALLGGQIDDTRARFEDFQDVTGETDKAFEKWAKTMGAQNARAFADMQVAMIKLGDAIAPLAADLMSFAASVFSAFSELPGPVRSFLVALAGVAAAAGPLLSVGGRLISVSASIYKALLSLAVPAGSVSSAFNGAATSTSRFGSTLGTLGLAAGVATAVVGIGLAIDAAQTAAEKAARTKAIDDLADQFLATGDASDALSQALEGNYEATIQTQGVFNQLLDTNLAAAERFIDAAEAAGFEEEAISSLRDQLTEKAAADQQSAADSETNTAATEAATGAFDEEAAAITAAVQALGDYSDALTAQFDPLFGMIDASNGVRDARQAVNEATLNLAAAEREHGAGSAEATAAERELTDAQIAAGQSALGLEQAQIALASAIRNGDVSLEDANARLLEWVESGSITQAEANILAFSFANMAGEVRDIPREWNTNITETGTRPVGGVIGWLRGEVLSVPTRRNTSLTATDNASARIRNVRALIDTLPRTRSIDISFRTGAIPQLLYGGARATGGPVDAGRLYEVAEQGRAELLRMGGRTYMIPGGDGRVLPAGTLAGGGAGSAPAAEATTKGFKDALNQSVARLISADSVQTTRLSGQMWKIYGELNRAQKERHIDLRQNLWVILKNRVTPNTFSATRYAQGLPQFADGGIVAGVHAGEMILNGAQQAQLWDLLSGRMVAGGAGGGAVYAPNITISMAGAIISSDADARRWVTNAVNKGLSLGEINNRGKVLA